MFVEQSELGLIESQYEQHGIRTHRDAAGFALAYASAKYFSERFGNDPLWEDRYDYSERSTRYNAYEFENLLLHWAALTFSSQ